MAAYHSRDQFFLVRWLMYPDYSKYTDNELISIARGGDADAEDALMVRYKNKVKIAARRYSIEGADLEDTIQEGMIGLYRAYSAYDPNGGASFDTFATTCVERAILSSVRKEKAGSRIPREVSVSLSALMDGEEHSPELLAAMGDDGRSDPARVYMRKKHTEELRQKARELLSPREHKVLQCYLSGMSQEESALQLNITRKSVDNALTRIRRKLAKADVKE